MKKQTILLVEADILARHPLAEYLRECGYLVVEAVSPDEAQVLVSESDAEFDFALIDAASAGGSAFAFVQWLRQNHPSIAISITGNVEKIVSQAKHLCEECESGSNLTKPYDHQAILDHIKQLLAARERARKSD